VKFDEKNDYGMVLISNVHSGANDLLARDIPKMDFVQLPLDSLKEYFGAYKFPQFTNHVILNGTQLISGDSKIYALGQDHFFRLADYASLTFLRDGNGKISGLIWEGVSARFQGVKEGDLLRQKSTH
jgi:hypothetical protein